VQRGPTGPHRLLRPGAAADGPARRPGDRPHHGADLIDLADAAGVRGRGGAGFPTAVKMGAVRRRRGRAFVVANGTEGEPASAKDKVLLHHAPHLVIDGLVAAAEAVGARQGFLCLERGQPGLRGVLTRAVAGREDLGSVRVEIVETPHCYVSGEETALVRFLNGGDAKPSSTPPRPFEKGVDGAPTLVDNVETLADLALVARHGPDWFRSAGVADEPGTRLFTIGGGRVAPRVHEASVGASLVDLLRAVGEPPETVEAVLVGGYFGTWLRREQLPGLDSSSRSLATVGASPGCGVLRVLSPGQCGLAESSRVTTWLAAQSAGQCGPCANGLPALAEQLRAVHDGGPGADRALVAVRQLVGLVDGRGACRLPDGTARFVTSTLRAFEAHIEEHLWSGPCHSTAAVLPAPARGAWR